MLSTRLQGPDRLPGIDCLRGAAALAVFVFHVAVVADFPKRTLPPFSLFGRTWGDLVSPLSLGAAGVNLFFVISGFCLALQQWRGGRPHLFVKGTSSALARYARNRVARIGPAYWLALLLSAALVQALRPAPADLLARDVLLHAAFLHGFHPSTFLSLNGSLWSMATEVQFYVLFPFLLWLCARLGGRRFIALAALANGAFRVAVARYPFAPNAWSTSWSALLAYQLPGRILEFALGMWLAEIYLGRDPRAASAFRHLWWILLPGALYARAFGPAWLPDMALGLLCFALCGAVVMRDSPGATAGDAAPGPALAWMARFGRASYSFFLIHYPLLVLLSRWCPLPETHLYPRFFFLAAVGLPLCLVAAVLLYRGVELPAWRRLRA